MDDRRRGLPEEAVDGQEDAALEGASRVQATLATGDRFKALHRKLVKVGVKHDEETKGDDFLQILGVSDKQREATLAATTQGLNLNDVIKGAGSCYPAVVPLQRGHHQAFVEEPADNRNTSSDGVETKGGAGNEHEAFIADSDATIPAPGFNGKSTWEEPEIAEVLISWKTQPEVMQKTRLSRGFPPATVSRFNLADIKAETCCFHFKAVGHFKKDCPKRRQGAGLGAHLTEMETGEEGEEKEKNENPEPSEEIGVPDAREVLMATSGEANAIGEITEEVLLAECDGYGIVDTACRRCVGGTETIRKLFEVLRSKHRVEVVETKANATFPYGNNGALQAKVRHETPRVSVVATTS